jgi:hypothetical protein
MTTTANMQWCNENEGRHYPLSDTATLLDNSGRALPTDIIADLHVSVAPAYRDAFISSVWITPTLLGVSISHASGALAAVTVDRTVYRPYTAVPLEPMPGLRTLSGWIVFGNYRYTVRQRWAFAGIQQSGLACRAMKLVTPPGITSVTKLGTQTTLTVDGWVRLSGSGYLTLKPHETDTQRIVIELAEEARPLFVGPCVTYPERGACGAPPLRMINGVCPDESGVITLRFR